MTIVMAGKITPATKVGLERAFGRNVSVVSSANSSAVLAGKRSVLRVPRPLPFVAPPSLKQQILFQAKKTEQVQLGVAFHGFPHGHPLLPATVLLSSILGGTMSSRLFVEVREKRGLCYSIAASHHALADIGVFSIMAGLDRGRVDEAIKVIWRELLRATRMSASREEVRRAKDHLRGRLMLAFEDSSAQADWYGKRWIYEGRLETPERWLKRIELVSADQMRKAAKSLFIRKKMAAALIGPFEHDKEFRGWFGLGHES